MREISILKKRILQFAEHMGITKYEIYQNTGISNGVFSQKGGLSEDNLLRFLSYYQNISADWLLGGQGEMLNENIAKKNDQPKSKYINVQDGNEYLVRRFEELVIENANLKNEINALKSGKEQSVSVVSPSFIEKEIKSLLVAEPEQEKFKK